MSHRRHEIPTHLNVEDRAFYGLSVRQATLLIVGLAGGYGLWSQWPDIFPILRLAIAATCVGAAAALALFRPGGRGLEEWIFVALRYLSLPKSAVWRPRVPGTESCQSPALFWEELSPHLTWKEDR